MAVRGSFRALFLYEAADQVRLANLRSGAEARAGERVPRFKHPAPEYVRLEWQTSSANSRWAISTRRGGSRLNLWW